MIQELAFILLIEPLLSGLGIVGTRMNVSTTVNRLGFPMQGWYIVTAGVPMRFQLMRIPAATVPPSVIGSMIHSMVIVGVLMLLVSIQRLYQGEANQIIEESLIWVALKIQCSLQPSWSLSLRLDVSFLAELVDTVLQPYKAKFIALVVIMVSLHFSLSRNQALFRDLLNLRH